MTKRLPRQTEHDPLDVSAEELAAARNDDALVKLTPGESAAVSSPVGLCFALSVNLEPTEKLFRYFADALHREHPRRLPAKRKRSKHKP